MNKINQPHNILAIDANTTSLAFALYSFKKLTFYGKINFEGDNIFEKVTDACKKTRAFFEFNNMIDAVIIEQSVYMNSPKTLIDLSMVQGSILGGAGSAGINIFRTVPPITWQTYLGNKKLTKDEQLLIRSKNPGKSTAWYKSYERNLRKERTIKILEVTYDTNIVDNDVADACGIGHWAINNWFLADKVDK